jgi:hypothetical protein
MLVFSSLSAFAYCNPSGEVQSDRVANYIMTADLDHEHKTAYGVSRIVWHNPSPNPVSDLKFYMYLNAFKNMKSTWLKPTGGVVFDNPIAKRADNEWGHITIDSIGIDNGQELTAKMYYVQDDGNTDDETVLYIPLDQAVAPGDSLVLNLKFTSKLPKTIARSGYGGNNFHLFVHWYPKLGVYEQDLEGNWGWNCIQFRQRTEFYGDFGNYDMTIYCDESFTVGASGCLIEEASVDRAGESRKMVRYLAEDVIDYAWCVSPELEEYFDRWEDVEIKLLVGPDHCHMADRYMIAIKHSLQYFDDHLGKYPYPGITLMDPPFHSLRNGFMEYPTFATAGTVYRMPKWFRGSESLAIHEFAHQFFMGVLASNEKTEPWLDEGFVTYYEDRIMESLFPPEESQVTFLGFKYGNSALSRNEYARMDHGRLNTAIARPGWEIRGDYKGVVYSKTATMLKTIEHYLGQEKMDEMMRSYYIKFKFTHPRRADFESLATAFINENVDASLSISLLNFLTDCLDSSKTIDYQVMSVDGNQARLKKEGELFLPITIDVTFTDDTKTRVNWESNTSTKELSFDKDIQSIHIDPEGKCFIDLNVNNNSYKQESTFFKRYLLKGISWTQHLLQSTTFLI